MRMDPRLVQTVCLSHNLKESRPSNTLLAGYFVLGATFGCAVNKNGERWEGEPMGGPKGSCDIDLG